MRLKNNFKSFFLTTLLMLCIGSVAHSWPSVHPTGVTLYNPDAAFNGYTLFTPLTDASEGTVNLINMNGEVVHRWQIPFAPLHARLLPNGNLVVMGRNDKQEAERPGIGKYQIGGAGGFLVELSWDGKLVWKHVDLNMHHDFAKLQSGRYLYLAWEKVAPSFQAKIRGGIKGSEFKSSKQAGGVMFGEKIVEVDASGKTVWTWRASEHLDPNTDIIGPFYKREEWLHANSLGVLQSGDIALTFRHTDSLVVIEKKTGKIRLRWGNAAYLDAKTKTIEYRSGANTLGGPHDAREIPAGFPGAGNMTCYDNGVNADASRAVEIDPKTRKQVWQSGQKGIGRMHFSNFVGGAQRLPNGNTLLCEGANGRLFQQTPRGEVVWEYINPFTPSAQYQGAVFKAESYAPAYCPQFEGLAPAKGSAMQPAANLVN